VRAPADPDPKLGVISYNIQFGREIEDAVELLGRAELAVADILLLQEISGDDAARVADALGFHMVYAPASVHAKHREEFGNAILSRWPLDEEEKVILPHLDHNDLHRIALVATASAPGGDLVVVCTHLGTTVSPPRRGDQVQGILGALRSRREMPVILGGDFNAFFGASGEVVEDLFRQHGYVDASSGVDHTYRVRLWRIPLPFLTFRPDRVYVRGLLPVASWRVRLGPRASDHEPVMVELGPPHVTGRGLSPGGARGRPW
jgi:endonuclease/exonuclease/phosphatase family metal-dependent hydrolase